MDNGSAPDKVWYFMTDENGEIDFNDELYRVKAYTFGTDQSQTDYAGQTITSSELNYGTTGSEAGSKAIIWDLGTYQLKGRWNRLENGRELTSKEKQQTLLRNRPPKSRRQPGKANTEKTSAQRDAFALWKP